MLTTFTSEMQQRQRNGKSAAKVSRGAPGGKDTKKQGNIKDYYCLWIIGVGKWCVSVG